MNIFDRTPNTLCIQNGNSAPAKITAMPTIVMLHTEWNVRANNRLAIIP